MSRKPTRSDCRGCRDDFYNGNNPLGVTECWNLKGAKFVSKRDIPTNLCPPYDHIKPTKRPDCYRANGYVRMKVSR